MAPQKKKPKIVYLEDKGETIYPMSFLNGMTPEQAEELEKKNKNRVSATATERLAMIRAAFSVYGPLLLCCIGAFSLAALFLYLFLK